jgi:hypothetical protein
MCWLSIFSLIVALLANSQHVWGATHSVSLNVATVVKLQDNDEIKLLDFPDDWYFSRIVLGVNSVPALQLSGNLVINDCIHELHGDYNEISFAYTGEDKIIYHGPAQNLPIQWWVDANPSSSSCKSYSKLTRRDSVNAVLYDFADSVYSEKIKDYIDLGSINSETIYEGNSANFKIVDLPEWSYNRILVQVESMDGFELDGFAFAGGLKKEVKGDVAQFSIIQKNAFVPIFELTFSEYRKIKIKWWAEIGVPDEIKIEAKETALSPDSVEVEYNFGKYFGTDQFVKVIYDKRSFLDGKAPVIKKLSFNPNGPDKSKKIGRSGDVYQIQADVNPNDSVSFVIPLGDYKFGEDSVLIEHYIADEKRKVLEPVDSIVGNYVYFKSQVVSRKKSLVDFFMPYVFPTNVEDVVDATPFLGACMFSSTCRKFKDYLSIIEKGLHRSLQWTFDVLKELTCPDVKTLVGIFETPKTSEWDPEQGNIATASILRDKAAYLGIISTMKLSSDSLEKLSDPYSEECNDEVEKCAWERTKRNLDRLLADAIISKFARTSASNIAWRRYAFRLSNSSGYFIDREKSNRILNFDDYFMTSSGLVEEAVKFVLGIQNCYSAINVTGRVVQNYVNFYNDISNYPLSTSVCNKVLGLASNGFETIWNGLSCVNFLKTDMSILQGHEGKFIAISEVMARIALLAWINKSNGFRDFSLLRYKVTYDGIRSWLELAGPFLDYNNIVIKAYAGLALFEYLHYGTNENLNMLNGSLNRHYGENGGFSEGTGYSLYIWEDVPYILAALKDVYESQNEMEKFGVSEKFMKSPDYMFDFSRPVGVVGDDTIHYGLIPIEVDDGVTYNPDYRVWAKLKDDPKYLAMTDKYGIAYDKKKNPLLAFGYPDESLYNSNEKKLPDRGTLWGDFKDGVAMIAAVNDDGDTVALSMVAENGDLWTRGQAHDQQDNLSITLTSSKKGFLIQDPGYSGFSYRSSADKFHRYVDHNVLTTVSGQIDNQGISPNQLNQRAGSLSKDFPGIEPNYFVNLLAGVTSKLPDYSLKGHGGYAASVSWQVKKPQDGVVGYTAETMIATGVSNLGPLPIDVYNRRTIMYFGENFWVIDRPNAPGLKWRVNSPIEEWKKIQNAGVQLYDDKVGKVRNIIRFPQNDSVVGDSRILQNGSRYDYVKEKDGSYYLRNYSYTAFGTTVQNYVMTYTVGEESFAVDNSNEICSTSYIQCFVNASGTKRVVVPRFSYAFGLCSVLPDGECSGKTHSTGITLLEKETSGKWNILGVLDGALFEYEFMEIASR